MTDDEELNESGGDAATASTVRSVTMSWRLLDAMGNAVVPMRVTELANQLGEPKAKIHRHLSTLRQLGVVEQVQGSEKYRLGWRLYKLGQIAFEQFDLKALSEPHMARLRDEVHQSVVLAIPTGVEALFISNLDYTTAEQPRISAVPGTVVPPAAAATGRIMLAFAPKKQQDRILAQKLRAYTAFTITDVAALRERLRAIRERLYDHGSQELTLGISTVAAPILGPDDELLGAVSIVGSMQFITDPPAPKQIRAVQRCAAAISAEFKSSAYDRIADQIRG